MGSSSIMCVLCTLNEFTTFWPLGKERRSPWPCSCGTQQAVVLLFNHAIALTAGSLQASTVEHPNDAKAVADQSGFLQPSRHFRHTRPPHSEHEREKFMRHRKFVAAHAVMRQQQPARAPLRDAMEAITHQ